MPSNIQSFTGGPRDQEPTQSYTAICSLLLISQASVTLLLDV